MGSRDCYHFDIEGRRSSPASIAEALRKRESGGFVWLNYCMPDREELSEVISAFGIHPLSVDDCFDEDQIPKIDIFPEYSGILFNDIAWKDGGVSIAELNIFLGRDFLVTVIRDETAAHYPTEKVLSDLETMSGRGITGPARVLHAILDHIVDRKFDAVEKIEEAISGIEDAIVSGSRGIDPAELQTVRKNLMTMRKSLFHEREILAKICRKDTDLIPDSALIFFSDIYDHLAKFVEFVETNREMITSIAQMHLSITNNEMAKSANLTNRSVSRLTFITTIFMPLTLLAGIGGMSEWTMITGADNWRISYPILLAAMALAGVANYFILKWIEKRHSASRKR